MPASALNDQRKTILYFLLILIATAISITITGFEFGIGNNVFHIPYVLQLNDAVQFKSDAFYQTLNKFASGVWPIIRGVSTSANIESVFLYCHYFSRALAFFGIFWFFINNGARQVNTILITLSLAAITPWLTGSSIVGGHGLLINYFTHSELTWGPLLAALVAAQNGKLILAALFTGIVFSINAFVGIWLGFILTVVVASHSEWRNDFKMLAMSILTFILVCIPVSYWIFISITGKSSLVDFSYIQYIRSYFPMHFLIESASFRSIRELFLIAYCGVLAAFLNPNKKFWLCVLFACILLLIIGSVLPYLFNLRLIFNLHLLRSDGILQFLSVLLSISSCANILIEQKNKSATRNCAVLILSLLISTQSESIYLLLTAACFTWLAYLKMLESPFSSKYFSHFLINTQKYTTLFVSLMCVFAIILELVFLSLAPLSIFRWVITFSVMFFIWLPKIDQKRKFFLIFSLCTLLSGTTVYEKFEIRTNHLRNTTAKNAAYMEMVKWIKSQQLSVPILIPVNNPYQNLFLEFQLLTGKSVWVDWKQGGAVMWDPSFHHQWNSRLNEIRKLNTANDFYLYALAHQLTTIVLPLRYGSCPNTSNTAFINSEFSVCITE